MVSDQARMQNALVSYCHNLLRFEQEKMIQRGFSLRLGRIKSKFAEVAVQKKHSIELQKIYKPFLKESSRIVPDQTVRSPKTDITTNYG